MKRNHVLLVLAALLGVVVVWLATTWSPVERRDEPALPTSESPEPPPSAPTPAAAQNDMNEPAATPTPAAPAQPAAEAPSPAQAPTEATPDPAPIPAPVRSGRVDELSQRWKTEPRDSAAANFESMIEAAFRRPEVPPGLFKSVQCRAGVCKIETRWTRERAIGFMGAFMHLVASPDGAPTSFDHDLAIDPAAAPDPDGALPIDVYLVRAKPAP